MREFLRNGDVSIFEYFKSFPFGKNLKRIAMVRSVISQGAITEAKTVKPQPNKA
jgi:hypothetical protein